MCLVEVYATMSIDVEELMDCSIQEYVESNIGDLDLESSAESVDVDTVEVTS